MSVRAALVVACVAVATCAVAEDPGTVAAWQMTTAGDEWTPMMALQQRSADSIPDEYATKEVHPILEFRCPESGGDITFQIDWQRFISSFSTEAGFRVDGGKATWIKLGVDASEKVTLGKAADARTLLGLVEGGETLNVEIAPYSEASVFVNFDVSTLDTGLAALREACE